MVEIENCMLIDEELEGVEELQMRVPDRHSRRKKRILDEIENGVEEDME